jgi:hypothetical protein
VGQEGFLERVDGAEVSDLKRIAEKIAKDPKVVARVRRAYETLANGGGVDAFEFLEELKRKRLRDKKQ